MKKIFIFFSTSILIIIALFISSNLFQVQGAVDNLEEPDKEIKRIVLGFSQIGSESEWRTASSKSINDAAAEAGIELKFCDAQQKQENQIKAIRGFIAQRVDVIAFTPLKKTGWEPVLKEAKDANIPVIIVDRTIDTTDHNLYTAYIGADFRKEGTAAAYWLEEELKDIDREINIFEIQGTAGSAPTEERKKGFEEVIKKHKNMKIIYSEPGDFMRSKGKEIMENFLKENDTKLDVIFSHNDDMAIGAISALKEAGLKPGKEILIVSVDAVRGAFEEMISGNLNCTVECNPLFGPELMELAKKIINGDKVPKRTIVKETVYTADVAQKELPNRKY